MKKVLLGSLIVVAIMSFTMWSSDPLNDIVNLIIAGSIPGTQLSIGLWSTLLLSALLLLIIRSGFRAARAQMVEHATKQTKHEQARTAFEEAHKIEFDRSQRSVIAARSELV